MFACLLFPMFFFDTGLKVARKRRMGRVAEEEMEMKREERAGKVKEEEEEKEVSPGTLPNSLETLKIRLEFVMPGEEASLLLIC